MPRGRGGEGEEGGVVSAAANHVKHTDRVQLRSAALGRAQRVLLSVLK